jgi:hypothetical protein
LMVIACSGTASLIADLTPQDSPQGSWAIDTRLELPQ